VMAATCSGAWRPVAIRATQLGLWLTALGYFAPSMRSIARFSSSLTS
jgi:hypothetical protein